LIDNQANLIPCITLENFSTCNFTNWDTLVIELGAGAMFAIIFFYIQHKNTKLINKMLQKQFDYIVKESINKIHWIQQGLVNIQTYIKNNKLDQAKKILYLNSEIFSEMEKILEKHKDIAPELVEAIRKLTEFNQSLIIPENPEELNKNNEIIKQMTSIVNEQAKNYGIKKFGVSPYPEYVVTLADKTRFRLNIPTIQLPIAITCAIIVMTQLFNTFGRFTFDTSIDVIKLTIVLAIIAVVTTTLGFRFRFRITPLLVITALIIPIMFVVLIFGLDSIFVTLTDIVFFTIAAIIIALFIRVGLRIFLLR
jgi:hypothetical protein